MTLDAIRAYINTHDIKEAVEYFLFRESIPAIPVPEEYEKYRKHVGVDHPKAKRVLIGGSGNWGFSFNPTKLYRPFGDMSDIDLVVVSASDFLNSWNNMREYHRKNWHLIGFENQNALRRSGENVYSGFITPKWIPDIKSPFRIKYEEMVNSYSNHLVGYKEVNLMYFRNDTELVDYYTRSFRIVRGASHGI